MARRKYNMVEEPVDEVVENLPEERSEVEILESPEPAKSAPNYEKIAKILYIYLEEIDKADKEHYRDHALVHGLSRNVAAKRLKWGERVNGEIVWKI